MQICELEPPPVEPPGYLAWRRSLKSDLTTALEMGNNEAKPCLLFLSNTEWMLDYKKQRAESEPLNDQVIFAWDKDEGVWALEATPEIFDDLKFLLGKNFLHWHEALESCGAVHYSHWRDCRWSKAAIEKSLDEGFATRPLFGRMSYLRTLRSFEAEDTKL